MASPQLLPVPLYTPFDIRSLDAIRDSRLYNGYVEQIPGGEKGEVWVYKRPGLRFLSTVAANQTGRGVFNWKGDIYSIFGDTLYKNGVSKGTVDTTSSYTFTSQLGATPKLFLKNKAAAYNYDDSNGLVQVTDGDYPATTVRGCAYLDGTTYVMNSTSNIQGDNFNDQTSWDPLNLIVAQIEPDQAMCLAKQLVYVVAIKTVSTEVFYDAGNGTGSPLGPVQGSKMGVGAISAETVAQCGDDLAWVGLTSEGHFQVMYMSKVHGEVISTPPIERYMEGLDFSVSYSFSAHLAGHRYYVVTAKNSNVTLVFDLTTGSWYFWTDSNGNYFPIVSATYSGGKPLFQHESNGNLYTMDPNFYQDDGQPFLFSLFTANVDGGVRSKKTCALVKIVADQSNMNVNVSWSDDDYNNFSTPVVVNLFQDSPQFQDGSSFYKRAYNITTTDNFRLRLKALNLMTSAAST